MDKKAVVITIFVTLLVTGLVLLFLFRGSFKSKGSASNTVAPGPEKNLLKETGVSTPAASLGRVGARKIVSSERTIFLDEFLNGISKDSWNIVISPENSGSVTSSNNAVLIQTAPSPSLFSGGSFVGIVSKKVFAEIFTTTVTFKTQGIPEKTSATISFCEDPCTDGIFLSVFEKEGTKSIRLTSKANGGITVNELKNIPVPGNPETVRLRLARLGEGVGVILLEGEKTTLLSEIKKGYLGNGNMRFGMAAEEGGAPGGSVELQRATIIGRELIDAQ